MRVVVSNCNTTHAMTLAICAQAEAAARPGTEIVPLTPAWGPESCESWYDSFLSAAAVLESVRELAAAEPFDALVMAGFGEHGRQGARELLDVPVVDITEAAAHVACLLGDRYAVVTSLARTAPLIEESLRATGTWDRCAGVYATGIPVLGLEEDVEATAASFAVQARRALADGADVVVLGCAGLSGLHRRLVETLDVPVVDGVAAAVGLAETLHTLGLSTSKHAGYATPPAKGRVVPGARVVPAELVDLPDAGDAASLGR